MLPLKRILRAVFVIPFTAGDPRELYSENITHDGSISMLVFLVSIVAIHCSLLVAGYANINYFGIVYYILAVLYTATISLCIIICIPVIAFSSINTDHIVRYKRLDNSGRLMLKFLWFFTIGSIIYYISLTVIYNKCFKRWSASVVGAVCTALMCVFRLVQATFLTKFSQYILVNSSRISFALLMLFFIDISVVVKEYSQEIYNFDMALRKTANETLSCNYTDSVELLKTINYLIPVDFECSLLALVFIMDIWQNSRKQESSSRLHIDDYDKICATETSYLIIKEDIPSLTETSSSDVIDVASHRMRKLAYIIGAMALSTPVVVFSITSVNNNILYTTKSCEKAFVILVLIICFYKMQTECKPTNRKSKFGAKEYLILISVLGSIGYYTIKVVPYILTGVSSSNASKITNFAISIFGLYFQTVFIFQMQKYENFKCSLSFFSLQYICLFLSVNNMITWAFDSIFSVRYTFLTNTLYLFYGKAQWNTMKSFLFPFVIFYRFKCFISFYGLYYKLKKG